MDTVVQNPLGVEGVRKRTSTTMTDPAILFPAIGDRSGSSIRAR